MKWVFQFGAFSFMQFKIQNSRHCSCAPFWTWFDRNRCTHYRFPGHYGIHLYTSAVKFKTDIKNENIYSMYSDCIHS